MGDVFNPTNYDTTEPTVLVAGDRWAWKRVDLAAQYPPASYSLAYELRRDEDGAQITLAAIESGDEYRIEVASSASATHAPGRYSWDAYITQTSSGDRARIASGTIEIKPNRSTSADDPRSSVRRTYEAVCAVLERRASVDQEEYTIAGRSLVRTPIKDLILLRDKYAALVASEDAKDRAARGLPDPRQIRVRLVRP